MDNETYGDVDCLKTNPPFCPFKSINLMDYADDKVEKFKVVDYSNDIKLLSCEQTKLNGLNDNEPDKLTNGQLDKKPPLLNQRNDGESGELKPLDSKLKSNLILCNSTNIFNEIEDVIEVTATPTNNVVNKLDSPSTEPSPINGQLPISTDNSQTKDLIDKNLISLATRKLLENSELEQLVKNQPLMQIEDLECILKSGTVQDLHANSRELVEQLSEQLNEQLNEQIELMNDRSNHKTEREVKNEKDEQCKEDEQGKEAKQQIEQLIDDPLIERLNEPMIEQISNEFKQNQQPASLSDCNDSQENKTTSQYHDETARESQNTTPVDSEFSFKYSSNRTLLKESSADYEEVFDDFYDDDLTNGDESYLDRLKRLEEEQEQLNSSLIALTSHFAQVQLRLKQIVDASPERKENLLKELEEFAFRGIPDYRLPELDEFNGNKCTSVGESNEAENDEQSSNGQKASKLQLQRDKQKELILKLKEQLEDLEKYAYETGDSNIIPSSLIMERQNVIIEELKGKLPLELDKMEQMSPEELRKQIDKAIRDLVNPHIIKEQLVDQLKTQVSDLERFIEFLQEGKICIKSSSKKGGLIFDGNVNQLIAKCKCSCTSKHSQECVSQKRTDSPSTATDKQRTKNKNANRPKSKVNRKPDDDELSDNERATRMIKRALSLLQVFTFVHGCNGKSVSKPARFERNTLKKTSKINHWGDQRAKLELTIDHLIELTKQKHLNDSDYTSECEETILIQTNEKITNAVRKQLCVLLRDLLEHGLNSSLNGCVSSDDRVMNQNDYSFMSWNCFSQRSRLINYNDRRLTIWDVLINYFYHKKGELFRQTPARKLSLSFNLDIVGGVPITPKQTLLSCIDEIMDTHTKLKRSADSHFKAFVSRALNEKRLVSWLKLIFKCKTIVCRFYEPWSYVNSTAFDEGLKSLDRLTAIDWSLPTDIAIRQLQNINDAF